MEHKSVGNIFPLTAYLSRTASDIGLINKMALNERERRVLELDQAGKTNAEIAHALGLHSSAVSRYRKIALKKLQQAQQDLAWAKQIGFNGPEAVGAGA